MNGRYKNGLAMLACVVAGALSSEALHGQTRPPAYLIGQIEVSDPAGYAKEYLPKAREIIKAHGGRLVAAAGAAASGSQVVGIDGAPPKRVVIYRYPSMEALLAWRHDPAYVQVRHVGEKYAKYHTFAVEACLTAHVDCCRGYAAAVRRHVSMFSSACTCLGPYRRIARPPAISRR